MFRPRPQTDPGSSRRTNLLLPLVVVAAIALSFLRSPSAPEPLLSSTRQPFQSDRTITRGLHSASGSVELATLTIGPEAVLLITADTVLHTTGPLIIAGTIQIRHGTPADPKGDAPDLTLISDTCIIVRGRIAAGRGAHGEGLKIDGGRGTDLLIQSPIARFEGEPLRAGNGGNGGTNGRGGGGGSLEFNCTIIEAHRPDFACIGGNGGNGGHGGTALPGHHGGGGGNVECRGYENGPTYDDIHIPDHLINTDLPMAFGSRGKPSGQPCTPGGPGLPGVTMIGGNGGDGGKGAHGRSDFWLWSRSAVFPGNHGGSGGHGGSVNGSAPGGNGGNGGDCPHGPGPCAGPGGDGGLAIGGNGGNGARAGNGAKSKLGATSGGYGGDAGRGGNAVGGRGASGGVAGRGTEPCPAPAPGGAAGPFRVGLPGKPARGGTASPPFVRRDGDPSGPGTGFDGPEGVEGWIPYQPPPE